MCDRFVKVQHIVEQTAETKSFRLTVKRMEDGLSNYLCDKLKVESELIKIEK